MLLETFRFDRSAWCNNRLC